MGRGNEIVTYIVDRNINYTNVCNVYCKFCAFYRTERDADHYVLSHEEIDQKIDELLSIGGIQILMQGGHHPKLGIDYYLNLLNHIREKYPQINVHAFSPPEFNHFAEVFRMPLREVIQKFKEAGLGIYSGRGRRNSGRSHANRISPLKCNTEQWLEVMQIAHELGLNSSATMMFGHVETVEDRIEHLERLRELQDQDGRFYGVYLLDVSAGKRRFESDAGRVGRIPANAGSSAYLFGQYREYPELLGNPGTEDRSDRSAIWSERFWLRDDGGKRGQQSRNIVPDYQG